MVVHARLYSPSTQEARDGFRSIKFKTILCLQAPPLCILATRLSSDLLPPIFSIHSIWNDLIVGKKILSTSLKTKLLFRFCIYLWLHGRLCAQCFDPQHNSRWVSWATVSHPSTQEAKAGGSWVRGSAFKKHNKGEGNCEVNSDLYQKKKKVTFLFMLCTCVGQGASEYHGSCVEVRVVQECENVFFWEICLKFAFINHTCTHPACTQVSSVLGDHLYLLLLPTPCVLNLIRTNWPLRKRCNPTHSALDLQCLSLL